MFEISKFGAQLVVLTVETEAVRMKLPQINKFTTKICDGGDHASTAVKRSTIQICVFEVLVGVNTLNGAHRSFQQLVVFMKPG